MNDQRFSHLVDKWFTQGFVLDGQQKYPPTNVSTHRDTGDILIELAVAGFQKNEITVEYTGSTLNISGQKAPPVDLGMQESPVLQYHTRQIGIRAFTRTFEVRGQYEPQPPTLKDGILAISLRNVVSKTLLKIE